MIVADQMNLSKARASLGDLDACDQRWRKDEAKCWRKRWG
jgi:hypothetical protein